ncbi:DUF2304 domain-containing protein [Paenibacillus tundrae]
MITKIFFLSLGLLLVIYVYIRVKKNLFSEKESMLWMVGSLLLLTLSLFPSIVDYFSRIIGISYPPSLLFLISMIFILFLLLRQSQQINVMHSTLKELVQRNALLESKVRKYCENNEDKN